MRVLPTFFCLSVGVSAAPIDVLTSRQQQCSTTFSYPYAGSITPSDYKAFNLGGCNAQLTFTKDRYVGVQWAFEATYADGSRAVHAPFRDFGSFGVSDTFYPYLGNNFLTQYPSNTPFTAVHEFTGVCKNGAAPVSWRFYTTSGTRPCFTTDQIRVVGGVSRPPKVSGVTLRRNNDAGDFAVDWQPVARAVAYSVIVQYPTGSDEIGNPYRNVRGARVQGTSTTVATTTRRQDVERSVIVHAVDERGVWSFTSDVKPVVARW